MSYEACSLSEASKRLAQFYQNFNGRGKFNHSNVAGGFVGGTAATGGMSSVAEYADSVYSKAKEDMIRKIASDMNDILGIKGDKKLKSDGPIEALVARMNEILPNPRKKRGIRSNKGSETKYSSVHKDLCKAFAESINKNYGTSIINLDQSDNALCNSVAEVVHSLIMGMHSEFSTIAADVSQVIRNLTVLMEYLKRSHEKMKQVVDASNDENIKLQSERVDSFYTKLVGETERQLAVLNNMMGGVIGPVNNDFVSLMKESDDFKGFVDDIKSSLGSEEFGNKLGYLLAGVNNLAQTARMVDKALKEVGMSVKAYKNTTGIENLRDEIYALLSKSDKLTADGLLKFMKAADVLYRNDLQHEQIVEYLEKGGKSGGDGDGYGGCSYCGASGGCGCGGASGGYNGGLSLNENVLFERKENKENDRYKAQDKVRKMIFQDFEKQLLSMYQKIIAVVQQIGPKIGNEIPVSDELMKFVRAFNQIEGSNRQNIASALSGYNKSGSAKDVRNSFLSSLDVVDITLDPLVGRNAVFKDLRNEIAMLIKLVDTFSSKFLDALVTPPSFKGGEIGGEVGGVIVDAPMPTGMVERYASFGRAQFQLYYFSRIASIKRSMARAGTEKKTTSEEYERLVGQAAARLINDQAKDYKVYMESLNFWQTDPKDWKTEAEFTEKLPKDSPGRALYFYVNTVSGYEPVVNQTQIPNYFRGNISLNGLEGAANPTTNATRLTHVTVWNGWSTLTIGNAAPDELVSLWNFAHGNAAPPLAIGNPATAPGDPEDLHTPEAAQMPDNGNIINGGIYHPVSNLFGLLGLGDPTKIAADHMLDQDAKGQATNVAGRLPKAFDKSVAGSIIKKRWDAADKLVEVIRELETNSYNAKKDLIEVAQNIDLYLSSFTDSMLSKPESILGLTKILQRVTQVRKMYTDQSGESLSHVFEMFPINVVNGDAVNTATGLANSTAISRKPGQLLSDVAIGADMGRETPYGKESHYYEYVQKVLASDSSLGNHKLALNLADIFSETKKTNTIKELMVEVERSVLQIRSLENILLAFVQLGNEQTNKTFMSHGKVLKSLFNYVINSAISRHYVNNPTNKDLTLGPNVAGGVVIAGSPFNANNHILEKLVSVDLYGPLKSALSVALNQVSSYRNDDDPNPTTSLFLDDYGVTDKIMELIMKAICSKILTVLGLYQIYNKPTTDYLSFGAIRSIIGGGSVPRPKIVPEAIDLYVRLPLLAEWFRDVFVGKSDKPDRYIPNSLTGASKYMLAMIPDVTTVWGEFLKTIFIKADLVEEGNYSDDDVNTLITEINKIYNAYRGKSQTDTVLSACEGLVSEINMRYSIIKKTDVDKYWDTMHTKRFESEDFSKEVDTDFVDFDLLDSKNGTKGKPAPSDKFTDVTLMQTAKNSEGWSAETFDLVRQLHARMFNRFNEDYRSSVKQLSDPEKFVKEGKFNILTYSFDGIIRQYKDELIVAASEDEKYKIACKAIQDVGRMSDINPDKIIMFHEFVIAPLTSLMSTYNMVRNFIESFIWMSGPVLNKVLAFLNSARAIQHATIGVTNAAGANAATTRLEDVVVGNLNAQGNYDLVLANTLRLFNARAAPFLRELFINEADAAEHGVTIGGAAPTVVFGAPAPNRVTEANESKLLSTKKLFKTHMQLFAAMKSALGNNFSLNFTNKSYPIVDISSLATQCEVVLNNVKKALVYLRPSIPLHIMRKYEDSTNVGSVYWLEEKMFSELFYNEKNAVKYDNSDFAVLTGAANPVDLLVYDDGKKAKFIASLPLLNAVLKDSFDVVVKRSAAGNGKSLCERGLLELCEWGFTGNTPKFEVNNDSKPTFPFNVVDLVDDIDPSLGKIRKLLLDQSLKSTVSEITKRFSTLESSDVNRSLFDKVFRLLRCFSQRENENMPVKQVRDLDMQYAPTANLPPLAEFLEKVVIPLFLDSNSLGGGVPKVGSPSFGTFAQPFNWNGVTVGGGVPGARRGVGLNAATGPYTETHARFTGTNFDEFKTRVFTAYGGAFIRNIGIVNTNRVDPAVIIPLPPTNPVNAGPLAAAKISNWVCGQIDELNARFNPYIEGLSYVFDPAVLSFLNDTLGFERTLLAPIQAIADAVAQLRLSIGYHHLMAVTTNGAPLDTVHLGLGHAGNNRYNELGDADQFVTPLAAGLSQAVASLFNNQVGGMDPLLNAHFTANGPTLTAITATGLPSLTRQQILGNVGYRANFQTLAGAAAGPLEPATAVRVPIGADGFVETFRFYSTLAQYVKQVISVAGHPLNGQEANATALADAVASVAAAGRTTFDTEYTASRSTMASGAAGIAYLGYLAYHDPTAGVGTIQGPMNARAAVSAGAAAALAAFNTFPLMINALTGGVLIGANLMACVTAVLDACDEGLCYSLGGNDAAGAPQATQLPAACDLCAVVVPTLLALRHIDIMDASRNHAGVNIGPGAGLYAGDANRNNRAAAIHNAAITPPAAAIFKSPDMTLYGYELSTTGLFAGFNVLPKTSNVAIGTIHGGGNAEADRIALVGGAIGLSIASLTRAQSAPLDGNLEPVNAAAPNNDDRNKVEPWLRRMVIKFIGTNDTEALKNNMNTIMRDLYGAGPNDTVMNSVARFSGMNLAFVINRIMLYDQWSSNGPLSTDKEESEKSIFNAKGLLVQFNQLLAAYIGTFIEPGTRKFYSPLIDGLVTSKISDAITSGNAIADINITDLSGVGIAPEGAVLFASIARAMRTLLYKKMENSKENQYSTNSLLEVAPFMRETMKGNLPHFSKMFSQLGEIATTYKKVLLDNPIIRYERANLNVNFSPEHVAASETLIARSQKPYINPNDAKDHNEVIRYYRILLDNLELSCNAVVRCIAHCYKELNDISLFGETYSGSLQEIKQKTGRYPLTLPSILQCSLNHKLYNRGLGLPGAAHGSDGFKLLFMSRRTVSESGASVKGGATTYLDYMPGVIEAVNSYNAINPDVSKLPKALVESAIKSHLDLMNILADIKLRASWLLGPTTGGGAIFRREIYGSALEADTNQVLALEGNAVARGVGVGFNNLTRDEQRALRTDPVFREYVRARGLSATNQNQSIYYLDETAKTYKTSVLNAMGARETLELTRGNGVRNAFNNLDGYPDDPAGGPAWLRGRALGQEQRLVAYSDVLKYPTSLVSYCFTQADNLSELISLCESPDLSYNKRHLLELFAEVNADQFNARSNARFLNILDLNIVPINVHALQQKVPLINLLNYAFTFDKFVIERLGISPQPSTSNDIFPSGEDNVRDVKSAFARMLIHPYATVTSNHFNQWHSRIAVGATGSDIPMDRPRYFSDQIYNKVCLQSLNPNDFENPGGPGYVMEENRYRNTSAINFALFNAAFTNADVNALLGAAAGAGVHVYPVELKRIVDPTFAGHATMALAPGIINLPALPAGNATIPLVNTVEAALITHVNGYALPAANASEVARFKSAVIVGIKEYCAAIRNNVGVNHNNGVVDLSRGRVRFTHSNGNGNITIMQDVFAANRNIVRTVLAVLTEANQSKGRVSQRIDALYYIADSDNDRVKRVDLHHNGSAVVDVLGKLRYDTRLVRNLSWFSHLHRFILWSLKQSLVKQSQPVVNDAGVIDPTLIDFRGYETQSRKEYHL